jgi:hypothetical protein
MGARISRTRVSRVKHNEMGVAVMSFCIVSTSSDLLLYDFWQIPEVGEAESDTRTSMARIGKASLTFSKLIMAENRSFSKKKNLL